MDIDFQKLKEPMEHEWKVQRYVKDETMGICVGYVNSRQVMDRLDDVVGPEKWQRKFKEVGGSLSCGIGLKIDGEWVWKWDVGSESNIESEKGAASDAFKRAAVNWGIGRFLYDLDHKFIDIKNKNPIDKNGDRIYDLTEYFNSKKDKGGGKNGNSFEDKVQQINSEAIVKRMKEVDSLDELKEVWDGLNTYAKHHEDVKEAKADMKAELSEEDMEDVVNEMES